MYITGLSSSPSREESKKEKISAEEINILLCEGNHYLFEFESDKLDEEKTNEFIKLTNKLTNKKTTKDNVGLLFRQALSSF